MLKIMRQAVPIGRLLVTALLMVSPAVGLACEDFPPDHRFGHGHHRLHSKQIRSLRVGRAAQPHASSDISTRLRPRFLAR